MIAAALLVGVWLIAMAMGIRILVFENLVKPGSANRRAGQ
jgi:hypothetical protein